MAGRLFGQDADVRVPKVSAPSSAIEDVDRTGTVFEKGKSVQLDIYIAGPEVWLGEAKHRRHAVSAPARETGILFTTSRQLEQLARMLQTPAGLRSGARSRGRAS